MPTRTRPITDDQPDHIVALCKALGDFQLVLGDATNQIVGYADVQRTSDTACENVDVEAPRLHL